MHDDEVVELSTAEAVMALVACCYFLDSARKDKTLMPRKDMERCGALVKRLDALVDITER